MKIFILLIMILLLTIDSFAQFTYAQSNFIDAPDYWATETVNWGVEASIINGYTDGTFRPYKELTEAEFASMFGKFVDITSEQKLKSHWSQGIYDGLKKI